MRECHPGEEHQGRRDDISKGPEVGTGLAYGRDGKLPCARAEGVAVWKGGARGVGSQARSQRALQDLC